MDELIVVQNGIAMIEPSALARIIAIEDLTKEVKRKQDEMKTQILAEMEDKGLLKVETEELSITYVAPTTRETFDSKTFKAENPDIYDAYINITEIKPSVRIKIK